MIVWAVCDNKQTVLLETIRATEMYAVTIQMYGINIQSCRKNGKKEVL